MYIIYIAYSFATSPAQKLQPLLASAARQLRPVDALDAQNGTAQRRVQALVEETEELSLARALGAEPKALETLELDGAPKIAFSWFISGWILWFMVDVTK